MNTDHINLEQIHAANREKAKEVLATARKLLSKQDNWIQGLSIARRDANGQLYPIHVSAVERDDDVCFCTYGALAVAAHRLKDQFMIGTALDVMQTIQGYTTGCQLARRAVDLAADRFFHFSDGAIQMNDSSNTTHHDVLKLLDMATQLIEHNEVPV